MAKNKRQAKKPKQSMRTRTNKKHNTELVMLVLIVAVFSFYVMYLDIAETTRMKDDAVTIMEHVVLENSVDRASLEGMAGQDYDSVKRELDVDSEFVVFLEDESGNIVRIGDKNEILCFGNPAAVIEGRKCVWEVDFV